MNTLLTRVIVGEHIFAGITSSPLSQSSSTFMPIRVSMGSVKPPQTTVVKMMMERVVQVYKSLFSPGMFSDSAKAIAPRRPANHITICILPDMGVRRKVFAKKENGNVLKNLAIKQNAIAITLKPKFHPLNLPVKKPIPIYKNTKNSDSTASDLKMLCAVT